MGGVERGIEDAIPVATKDKVGGVGTMVTQGSIERGEERGTFRGGDRGVYRDEMDRRAIKHETHPYNERGQKAYRAEH
jgi:hypothetical protein